MERRLLPGPVVLVVSALLLLACVGGVGFKVLEGGADTQRASVAAQDRALAEIEAAVAPADAGAGAAKAKDAGPGTAGQVQGTSAAAAGPSTCTSRLRHLVSALDAAGRQARIGLAPELDEAILARAALESGRPRCPRAESRTAVAALATYVDAQSAPDSARAAAWTRAAQDVARARRQLAG